MKAKVYWHFHMPLFGGCGVGVVVNNTSWTKYTDLEEVINRAEMNNKTRTHPPMEYKVYKVDKRGKEAHITGVYSVKEAKRLLKISQL